MNKNKRRNNNAVKDAVKDSVNQAVNLDYTQFKLCIAVLSEGYIKADCTFSLANMAALLGSHRIPAGLINVKASSGPQIGRYAAVKQAQSMGATHILFIDSDQAFPPVTATQLLMHQKPIVGCAISQRIKPFGLNAKIHGQRIMIDPNRRGLLPVETLGTGIMLIDMMVFTKLQEPYFETTWKGGGEWHYEDETFCERARLAGFDVFVDCDLSRHVGHIGDVNFTIEHSWAFAQQQRRGEPAPEEQKPKIALA